MTTLSDPARPAGPDDSTSDSHQDQDDVFLFPASFAQRRLWFLDQLMPGNPFYNISAVIPLEFAISVPTYERCLNEIVERHESLRTAFTVVDGEPYQAVRAHVPLHLDVHDLRQLPAAEADQQSRHLIHASATEPFRLDRTPLLRAGLIRHEQRRWTFLLTMHHIVSDGWSIGILFQELEALYASAVRHRSAALPPLPIQYGDFAVWQRQHLQGKLLLDQVGYWKRRLADAPTLELRTDRPRPAAQSFRGASHRIAVSANDLHALKAVSREHNATLYMVLLTAFVATLRRDTGRSDIVVGLPVAGRGHRLVEGLIGFFINSLVLRTDLAADPTLPELLAHVRSRTLEAFAHQDLPFEKLVEELHVERDLGRNPLFQVTFQLVNAPTLGAGTGGNGTPPPPPRPPTVSESPHATPDVERGTAMFDLAFDLYETPDGLTGRVEYSTDLFDPDTVTGLATRFQTLLRRIADHPNARLSVLTGADDADRERLLAWNNTDRTWPKPALLHELIARQASRTPAAVAVDDGRHQVTYQQLTERVGALARTLAGLAAPRHGIIGLCLPRSLDLVVGMLAVLHAGHAYLPLDPEQPTRRLAMLAASATAVLTNRDTHATAHELGVTTVLIDETSGDGRQPHRRRSVHPDDLAYVLHTSGSTGRPKGVMVTHRSAVNHMRWMQHQFPLTHLDRVLQRTAPGFDASVWEFFAPLAAGARLILAPPDGGGDPSAIARTIRLQHVTVVQATPSLLSALLDDPDLPACITLEHIFAGGETLTPQLRERCRQALPAVTLHNLYGPSEATIDATAWTCGTADGNGPVPIGRPIANCRAYVLDDALQPAPIGVAGELYLGGIPVARGYLDRPALTAERFLPDPFTTRAGARMYRTGDRVRHRADGALEYLGRLDDQIKLRGVRIEPGDVAAALRDCPGVHDAAVTTHREPGGDVRLAAYYVPDSPGLDPDDLWTELRARLPTTLMPSYLTRIEALPRTARGKIDTTRLPDPTDRRQRNRLHYAAPRSALERVLTRLWADVLRTDGVGIHDGFFNELGGHSLLATQLISRIRETLDVEIPLAAVFQAPTVAQFAELLLRQDTEADDRLERIAELVLHVDSLDEDEIDALLDDRGPDR